MENRKKYIKLHLCNVFLPALTQFIAHDIDLIVEEVRSKGGIIAAEPFIGADNGWEFRNAHIQNPDGYNIVLGGMRVDLLDMR
jgi:predicted enzyme related to lactoylglutathione lyase